MDESLPEQIEHFGRNLGLVVRGFRNARNLSQAELATEAGVAQSTISALENGDGGNISTLLAVASALDVNTWRMVKLAESQDETLAGSLHRLRLQAIGK